MANDLIIDTLNDLIETSKDGEYGFRSAQDYAEPPELKQLFESRAKSCREAVAELQGLIRQLGGSPDDSGSLAGAMHRGWVSAKATLSGMPTLAILEEVERGEDIAMERYRKALAATHLPADVRTVIERQFEGVKRNHAQIRSLRDQAKAQKA